MVAFNISDEDIDALARMAYAEAEVIASDTGDLREAYGSIVDAILNRAAANRRYLGGARIQSVINHSNKPGVYQFTPLAGAGGSWRNLEKPPQEVYDAVRAHLARLQQGRPNVVGKNTHYLNVSESDSSNVNGWAKGWPSWQLIGIEPNAHRFGKPDNLTIPDYSVSYDPPGIPPPPAPAAGASPATHYQYAGLTRSLAPTLPVDRTFNTPEAVYSRMATTGGLGGILGLDGRGAGGLGAAATSRGAGGLGRDNGRR
jgi:hypothetical protein